MNFSMIASITSGARATDPMRVVSLPYSLNGKSGLVCIPIGGRKSFEKLDINSLVLRAYPLQRKSEGWILNALDRVYSHPELYESASPMADAWGGR